MKHETVLLHEAISSLNLKPEGLYVDGTLGGAGHSKLILSELKKGFLYAFDQDQFAIDYAKNVLRDFSNYEIIKSNFRYMKQELNQRNVSCVDGILLDLGLSSFQIDDEKRGFTYLKDTTLDMRMDQNQDLTAQIILNTYDIDQLAKIFYLYGEEKNSYKIAREIILKRPLETTMDLVKVTDKINRNEKGHSAKRVFQALRIAVNDELGALEQVLKDGLELLRSGGRMVVITFHSLEDRIVKHLFREQANPCSCPPDFPICVCEKKASLEVLTRKPIIPGSRELSENNRSRSAKLRVAIKMEP